MTLEELDKNIDIQLKDIHIVPPKVDIPDTAMKEARCKTYLSEVLGYPYIFSEDNYTKLCNKYYDVKKYHEVANKIVNLMMNDKEVPQELINYMLKIKDIREKNNL